MVQQNPKGAAYSISVSPPNLAEILRQFVESQQTDPESLGAEPDYLNAASEKWALQQGSQCTTVIAVYRAEPVAVVNFNWSSQDPTSVTSEGLRVLPNHRGQGLTRRLLDAFLSHHDTQRKRPFVLREVVATDNAGANAIARHSGMMPTVAFQTLEHGFVGRVRRPETQARPLSAEDALAVGEAAGDMLRQAGSPLLGLCDWRPTVFRVDAMVEHAAQGRLLGCMSKGRLDAVAVVSPDPCLVRPSATQISCVAAKTEQSAHDIALYLESVLPFETRKASAIAHPLSGSLMASVLFARGWRPNRWYQDVVHERAVDLPARAEGVE